MSYCQSEDKKNSDRQTLRSGLDLVENKGHTAADLLWDTTRIATNTAADLLLQE